MNPPWALTLGCRMFDVGSDEMRAATQEDVDKGAAFGRSYDVFIDAIRKAVDGVDNKITFIHAVKQAMADLDARRFLYVPTIAQDPHTAATIERQKAIAAKYFIDYFGEAMAKAEIHLAA